MSKPGKSLLKVVVLGDAGVGKTSLVKQYVEHKFDEEYKPTIGADFLTKDMTLPGRGSITLQIWDTAGQERFKSMAVSFYRGADACVLCYDITDPKSFTNLEMWMQEFTEATDIDKDKFPFIVLGNKADKPEEERQIEKSKAEAWCKGKNNIPIFETSAISKLNLDEAFDVVAQAAGRGELIPQGVALASVADLEQKENDEEKLEEEDPEPEEQEAKPPSKAIIKRDGKKGRRAASQANASPRHKKGASRAARRAPLPESSESDSETDSAGLHSRHGRSDRPSRRASPNDDRDHHRGGGTRSRGGGGRNGRSRRSVSPDGTINLDDSRSYYSNSSDMDRNNQCCLGI